jgi:glycosyltransferase involved in cell wall biosynthesis
VFNRAKRSADIALLLEGTYPYVRGGVSGWVHELISGLPEFTFSLVFLGATRDSVGEARYTLPDNVVSLTTHFLMEPQSPGKMSSRRGNATCFAAVERLHEGFRDRQADLDDQALETVLSCLGRTGQLGAKDFFYSEAAWRVICDNYARFGEDSGFIDYFWTVRNMHSALFRLAEVMRGLPPAQAYHSVSTGYAGFLGALLHRLTGRTFLVTEHGIYTKERKIDIQAAYIQDSPDILADQSETGMQYHHHLWIQFFEGIGRMIYAAADPIISLYDRNRQRQIDDGADPARTRVIPNGIDLDRLVHLRAERADDVPPVLGLIGRIVPIKDIKTFIRAMRGVCTRVPQAEGWLIGPEDEDPQYARECRDLVSSLGLEANVRFLGFQDIRTVLPKLGVLVLTSISEAFPLVLLEGFASGLPAVTTDVGACREIIEGGDQEDRGLGAAGAVVPIASPQATAQAALELLTDTGRWRSAQTAAIQRVERYYGQDSVLSRYRDIYRTAIEG